MQGFSRLYICLLLSVPSISCLHAQVTISRQALLLKTDGMQPFRVYRISRQLDALEGVHLMGYLAKAQTLMITYDTSLLADPAIIITAVEHLNQGTCVTPLECDNLYAFIEKTEQEFIPETSCMDESLEGIWNP